jgi:endonuclease YncB( thermonuclease family)
MLMRTSVPGLTASTLILFMILFLQAWAESQADSPYGLEVYGTVIRVVDGDTLDVRVISVYKDKYLSFNGSTIRVRLADINAPELGTPEGEEAKWALTSLVYGRSVYLDIDDLHIYDIYGRVVAVAYLPVNTTHLLNINLWLVLNGYAEIRDYPNEFKPSSWSLYIALATGTQTPMMTFDREIMSVTASKAFHTSITQSPMFITITTTPQSIMIYRKMTDSKNVDENIKMTKNSINIAVLVATAIVFLLVGLAIRSIVSRKPIRG